MSTNKRDKIIYWILTILVLAPTAGSGVFEILGAAPENAIHSLQTLGYPMYLLRMLGSPSIFSEQRPPISSLMIPPMPLLHSSFLFF